MELFGIIGVDTLLLIVFAVLFYRAADIERTSKILWVGLSLTVSLVVRLLAWGLLALILGQVLLFFAIAIVRALLSKKD